MPPGKPGAGHGGWPSDVDRALVILLSGHTDGDTIRYSELFPVLRRYGLSAERTIEILSLLGLFADDRVPAFETWLERKLADVAPGIRHDAEDWLRTLRHGGRRARARSKETAWSIPQRDPASTGAVVSPL